MPLVPPPSHAEDPGRARDQFRTRFRRAPDDRRAAQESVLGMRGRWLRIPGRPSLAHVVTSQPRYWNVFRRTPSGRDQKRILNRAVTCPLCTNPLGTGRALYQAYTDFSQSEMIAAHPRCADEHMRQLTERLTGGISQMLRRLA